MPLKVDGVYVFTPGGLSVCYLQKSKIFQVYELAARVILSVCLLLAKSKIFQVYWSVDFVILSVYLSVCLSICLLVCLFIAYRSQF